MTARQVNGTSRSLGWAAYAIAALLGAAILFGGGGAEGPLNNGIILAASAFVLFTLLASHWLGLRPLPASATVPVLLLAGFALIGLAQLIPLPASIWRNQPGREVAASILGLVGSGGGSRPLSLDPEGTRRSLEALLLPAAVMVGVLGSNRREISIFLYTVLACAVASCVIGAVQLALGYPSWLTYYAGPNPGAASGVFANVNHHAAFLLAAIVCVGLAVRLRNAGPQPEPRRRRGRRIDWLWLLTPLFIVLVFATGSRAALLLVAIAVPMSLVIAIGRSSPRLLIAAVICVAVAGLVLAEVTPAGDNMAIGQSFLFSSDARYAILPDVILTLKQYWPTGSGLGTFVQVFAANENLDIAGYEFVNHAHNDLLELLIEFGLAGLFWVIAAAGAIVVRVLLVQVRDRSDDGERGALVWAGLFVLLLFALHSLVDFPLRTEAVAAVAGVALGLVFIPARPEAQRSSSKLAVIGGIALAGILSLIVGGAVIRSYAAEAAVRAGNGAEAVRWDFANGAGLALAAEQRLVAHQDAGARELAADAIRRSPLSVRAVRVLAVSEDLENGGGMAAWRLASELGWRDPATQFWAMRQALANREFATAAVRADALLRTSVDPAGERIAIVRVLCTYAPFRAELVRRLLLEPRWAETFFNLPKTASDQELGGVFLTLTDLARAGSPVTPADVRRAIQVSIDRRYFGAAVMLDRLVPRRGGNDPTQGLDFDQDTDHYVFDVTPFDWNILEGSGTVVSVEQSDRRRVLVLGTDGRRNSQIVRKYLALEPGTYRLDYEVAGKPESPSSLGFSIYCAGSAVPIARSPTDPLQGADFNRREVGFSVGGNCPLVLLAFEAKRSEGAADTQFANLTLNKI